jgi:hypothetical protein
VDGRPPIEVEPTMQSDPPVDSGVAPTLAPDAHALARPERRPDHERLVEVDPRHYDLGRVIASGGMGSIREARDLRLGRIVAIKELLVATPELRARFEREARITARLQHPAIVGVLEAGTWPSGEPFYAMKLVRGEPLDKVVAQTRTLEQRLALLPAVIAVCDALAYAHRESVIHRDLKPANVLVGAFGETVVIDWGLAKDLSDPASQKDVVVGPYRGPASADATVAGAVMGTPSYMPPEQARGEPVDATADVYSLGALLHHVLAGAPPYTGPSAEAVLDQVLARPPSSLAAVAGVAADLAAIVDKAMARAKADRYPTAAELAEELKKFQTGKLVTAHTYTARQLLARWLRRHRAVVSVATLAALALGGFAAWSIVRIDNERDAAVDALGRAERDRAAADTARKAAEQQSAHVLFEEGRGEFVKRGGGGRALTYLLEANRLASTPTTRLLLGEAAHPYLEEVAAFPIPGGVDHVLLRDGTRVLAMRDVATGSTLVDDNGHALATLHVDPGVVELGNLIVGSRGLQHGPDRQLISDSAAVVVVDATTGAVTQWPVPMPQAGQEPLVALDRDHVLVSPPYFLNGPPWILDIRNGELQPTLFPDSKALAVNRDASRIAYWWRSDDFDLHLGIYDRATRARVAAAPILEAPERVRATPLGLVQLGPTSASILEWSGHTTTVPFLVPQGHGTTGPSVFVGASIAATADGFAILAGDGNVQVVDGKLASRLVDVATDARTAVVCADGRMLVRDAYGTVVWSPSGDPLDRFDAAGDAACTASGEVAVVDELAARARRFHPAAPRLHVVPTWDDCISGAHAKDAASPFDADGLAVLAADTGAARVDARAGKIDEIGSGFQHVTHVAYRHDGTLAAIVEDRRNTFVDIATGTRTSFAHDFHAVSGAELAGDRYLVVSAYGGIDFADAEVYELSSGKVTASIHFPITESVSPFGLPLATTDPAGAHVIAPSPRGATIYDIATGVVTRELVGLFGPAWNLRFAPDGRRVVGVRGVAIEWDVATGAELHRYAVPKADARTARYSPDGSLLVTSHDTGPARVWNTRTGELVVARDEDSRGFASDLSSDASLGATGNVVWDARTGHRLFAIETPAPNRSYSWPEATWFSPRGDAVAGGSCGKHWVRRLDLAPSAADLDTVAARVPWRLVDGTLVPREVPAFHAQ